MKIEEKIINEVLEPYTCRVLRTASLEYPIIRGIFLIGPTFYHIPVLKHATDIDIQLCLNQLAYAGVAEMIRLGEIPEFRGLNFEELRGEGMLIIESKKRFRRPIPTDREISGEIFVYSWRDIKKLFIVHTRFQFENRSCFGDLELVLIKGAQQ